MKIYFKILVCVLLVFCVSLSSHAQDTEDYEYTREFIWGINKNTNSGLIGGLVFKYSKAITPKTFQTFGVELVNVKHPKEIRYSSRFTGNTFIFEKINHFYAIRGQYGREWVIFKKAPQQGIQINGHISGGPTLGIVAPYYVEIPGQNDNSRSVRYDPNDITYNTNDIYGTGGIFKGLGESKIQLGLNVKTSFVFEFGTFKNNVTGFETGFMVEAFPNEIPMLAFVENKSLWTSAFITLFYGSRR